MLNYLPALLACVVLAGCADIIPYAAPAEGRPAASLRFAAPNAGHVMRASAYGLASGTCEGARMNFGELGGPFGLNFTDRKPLGMLVDPNLDPKSFYERKIPAGQRYMLFSYVSMLNDLCTYPASFVPEAGAEYQATVAADLRGCRILITRLRQTADGAFSAMIEPSARGEECRNAASR